MTGDRSADREWVVLLEAADERGGSTIGRADFARLVASWATPAATTLYSPSRYALQLEMRAIDPASALSGAMRLWKEALRRTELPDWELARAEVLTPGELENEIQAAERATECDGMASDAMRAQDPVGDELLRRALFDSLTGLPDRAIFLDQVRGVLASSGAAASVRAVLVVGLDRLLPDGRPPGSPAQDDLLVKIAGQLRDAVRSGDTLARIGPTQFALLMGVRSEEEAERVARRIVGDLRPALRDRGHAPAPTASVGVATSSSGADADGLLLLASEAMGEARAAGGDCHRRSVGSRP